MRLVWPDSFVEEANLTQTIFVLRRTLGEGPDGKPFIDTLPRRGYRFVADVREEIAKPAARAARPAGVRTRGAWIATVLVAAAVIVWFGTSGMRRGDDTSARIDPLVLPFGNLSDDDEQTVLADSLTDALITNLGQISGLRVISRTSAMTILASATRTGHSSGSTEASQNASGHSTSSTRIRSSIRCARIRALRPCSGGCAFLDVRGESSPRRCGKLDVQAAWPAADSSPSRVGQPIPPEQ